VRTIRNERDRAFFLMMRLEFDCWAILLDRCYVPWTNVTSGPTSGYYSLTSVYEIL
jgi:hypothetical protein